MRILKLALYTIGTLTLLYLALCAFSPATFSASQSISINAGTHEVFPLVTDFKHWDKWSQWKKSDPDMTNVVEGTPGTVGHKQTWKSKKEGDGIQDIIELKDNSYIKMGLYLVPDNPKDVNYSDWYFTGDSTKTEVKWNMTSATIPFPGRGIVRLLGIEKTLNEYFAKSLANLKAVAER